MKTPDMSSHHLAVFISGSAHPCQFGVTVDKSTLVLSMCDTHPCQNGTKLVKGTLVLNAGSRKIASHMIRLLALLLMLLPQRRHGYL